MFKDESKVRFGCDKPWKPQAVPTPGEARAFSLEKEVVQLRQSLERMANGSAFKSSDYWSQGFHPPTGPPEHAGFPTSLTDLGQPDPKRAASAP